MKRSATVIGIAMLIFCFFLLSMSGCAKTAVSRDEGLMASKKRAAEAEAAAKLAPAPAPAPALATPPAPAAPPPQEDPREVTLRRDAAAEAAAAALALATAEKAAKIEFEDIRFAYDKSAIEPEGRETLKKLADWLMKNRNYALAIEGHCDERGTVEYNLALGQRRADASMKYLVDLGVDKANIATISYGKERPLDPGQNEDAWAKNRRANFTLKVKK